MNTTDIYVQAAKAAATDLRTKMAEMEKLRKRLDQLQTEVNHLQMIAAYGQGNIQPSAEQGDLLMPDGSRQPRGQAMARIIDILSTGKSYSATDIRIEVAKKFGISYGVSTIYANLSRGKTAGQFEQAGDDQWRLKK